jgi:hypothetical protein
MIDSALQFLFSQNENTGSNGYASQFITLNDGIKKETMQKSIY